MQSKYDILKQYWGFSVFRSGQEEAIDQIMAKEDLLAVFPTGGGKSLCYQLPAIIMEGSCLVISPLIALMNDQIQQLKQKGIAAAAIHSGMSIREIDRILDNAVFGKYQLFYVSPERIHSQLFASRFAAMQVSFVAVDEAHCISQWGHDFRPAYLEIKKIRDIKPAIPFAAFTATATPKVKEEIIKHLELRLPTIIQNTLQRKNLNYSVKDPEDKISQLIELVRNKQLTILYVRSRGKAEKLAGIIRKYQVNTRAYHAGMEKEKRNEVEKLFLTNRLDCIVATTAFGMGINKNDVRQVIHFDLPASLEEYYQEAGRAGRDDKAALALLLADDSDKKRAVKKIEEGFPPIKFVGRVYQAIGNYLKLAVGSGKGETFTFDIEHFCEAYNLPANATYQAIKILEQSSWLLFDKDHYSLSTITFRVNHHQLYDYQIRHREADSLIKALLRLYDGILQQVTPIYESRIASFIQWDRTKVKKMLEELNQHEILQYTASNSLPSLTFLEERVSEKNLTIDHEWIAFRKKVKTELLQGILEYVETEECRQKYIGGYFGEEQMDCGTCDNCIRKHKESLDDNTLKKLMLQYIEKDNLQPRQLIEKFHPQMKNKLLEILQRMVDQGMIEIKQNQISIP